MQLAPGDSRNLNPVVKGAKYRATYKAAVMGILGGKAPRVISRGRKFYNRDRWTLRILTDLMCAWAKKNPGCVPSHADVALWVQQANEFKVAENDREIVIANTPEELPLRVALALVGGADHEALHTLYSCKRDITVREAVDLIIPRWAKVQDWSKYVKALLEWSNYIEDIRIERRGREEFDGINVKLHDLQDFILQQEESGQQNLRSHGGIPGALSVVMGTFRDFGFGYDTERQRRVIERYRRDNPNAVELVLNGPLTPLLDESIELTRDDDTGCLRIAMDVISVLAELASRDQEDQENTEEGDPGDGKTLCPACGADGSQLKVRPKADPRGGQVRGRGIVTCTVCGWQDEIDVQIKKPKEKAPPPPKQKDPEEESGVPDVQGFPDDDLDPADKQPEKQPEPEAAQPQKEDPKDEGVNETEDDTSEVSVSEDPKTNSDEDPTDETKDTEDTDTENAKAEEEPVEDAEDGDAADEGVDNTDAKDEDPEAEDTASGDTKEDADSEDDSSETAQKESPDHDGDEDDSSEDPSTGDEEVDSEEDSGEDPDSEDASTEDEPEDDSDDDSEDFDSEDADVEGSDEDAESEDSDPAEGMASGLPDDPESIAGDESEEADTQNSSPGEDGDTSKQEKYDWSKLAEEVMDQAETEEDLGLKDAGEALEEAVTEQVKKEDRVEPGEAPWCPYDTSKDQAALVRPSGRGDAQDQESDKADADLIIASVKAEIAYLRARLRTMVRSMEMTSTTRGVLKGRALSSRYLTDTIASIRGGQDPRRAFDRKGVTVDLTMSCAIVLDESGSMDIRRADATRILVALTEPLDALQCPTFVLGFRNGAPLSYGLAAFGIQTAPDGTVSHRRHPVFYDVFKGFNERFNAVRWRFANTKALGSTPLADGIQFALNALSYRKEAHRILFVVTDGEPDPGTLPVIRHQIRLAKEAGVQIIGIGVGEDAKYVKTCFIDHVWSDNVSEFPKLLLEKLNSLIDVQAYKRGCLVKDTSK